MKLPFLKYQDPKYESEIVALGGINLSDDYKDGDIADSLNISARRYPYITTRHGRTKQSDYANITALTSWDKLVAVSGTNLLYDGDVVGTITEGEKKFAVVNTKLCIFPDKVYLDLTDLTVKALGAKASGSNAEFTSNTMTIPDGWSTDLTDMFKVGDCIKISGCTGSETAVNNISIVIQDLAAKVITVSDDGFTAGSDSGEITIERAIPDMDFVCESGNRLWGCSSEAQTIYASALGDPTNFNTFEGVSTDSYSVAVGSVGDFTGCCKLSSSVLFWKESVLHKLLGTYPAEYQLYDYTLEGLKAGCDKSLVVINEVLFYLGLHGVYAYSGGTPSLISANFGEHKFLDGVAGNDGDTYYLSCSEGSAHYLFAYETKHGIWVKEDELAVVDFARMGEDLYCLDSNGDIYLMDSGSDDVGIKWNVRFVPMRETIKGRKIYSKILLRIEMPANSEVKSSVRMDNGEWIEVGKIFGRNEDVFPMVIPINRCDKFEIMLSGIGPCAILSASRKFRIGSDA